MPWACTAAPPTRSHKHLRRVRPHHPRMRTQLPSSRRLQTPKQSPITCTAAQPPTSHSYLQYLRPYCPRNGMRLLSTYTAVPSSTRVQLHRSSAPCGHLDVYGLVVVLRQMATFDLPDPVILFDVYCAVVAVCVHGHLRHTRLRHPHFHTASFNMHRPTILIHLYDRLQCVQQCSRPYISSSTCLVL